MSDQKAALQAGPWSGGGAQAIHPPSTPLPAGKFKRHSRCHLCWLMGSAHCVQPGEALPTQLLHYVCCGPGVRGCFAGALDSWHSWERTNLWRVIKRLQVSATAGQTADQRQSWELKCVLEASTRRVSSSIHPRHL